MIKFITLIKQVNLQSENESIYYWPKSFTEKRKTDLLKKKRTRC